jgi:glycyl-tRNA synthetase beta chain
MDSLLVELLVEELPPKALHALGKSFGQDIRFRLQGLGLLESDGSQLDVNYKYFASPRRLAVWMAGVRPQAADMSVRSKLMPVLVGLDGAGVATPALLKKLATLGADATAVPQLKRAMDGKAETLFLDSTVPGATLLEGLQKAVLEAIDKLPIPKVMQYQLADGWTSVSFVRPAHGLVALYGDAVVPVSVLGLQAGRTTKGHRFEAAVPLITLRDADHYADQLREEGAVVASFAERRDEVVRQLNAAADKQGLQKIDDRDPLLDEVTALVERPNVLTCRFESDFLAVPQECLILTMKANQKYFPLLNAQGRLTNQFLVVSNIRPADASRVIQGNERVVRPRLADAKFFFDQDRKKTLESRVEGLARVVYHAKLGTMAERTERVKSIAYRVGVRVGSHEFSVLATRAAHLAKADLLTDMVGEFPELQGTMGAYYARNDGEDESVALAIEDHYRPRFAGDVLPREKLGLVVALADKLESVAGLFSVGVMPTGDKDPFALRRQVLGVIRILLEGKLRLHFGMILEAINFLFAGVPSERRETLVLFFYERLSNYLRELGFGAHEVDAVVAIRPELLMDVPARLAALKIFSSLPESAALAAANKRVANILNKSDALPAAGINTELFVEQAEGALLAALKQVPLVSTGAQSDGFVAQLTSLANLKGPIDDFFETVMVNAEDPALRRNRLALLAQLHAAMNRVADLSRLAH